MKPTASASVGRWSLLTVALAAGLGLVLLFGYVRRGEHPDPLSSGIGDEVLPQIAKPALELREESAREDISPPPSTPTANTFLADYWGEDWPRVEEELRKQEGWENVDFEAMPLPPTLDVAIPKLREQLSTRTDERRNSSIESYLTLGLGSGRLEDEPWIQSNFGKEKKLGASEFATIRSHVGYSQRVLEESAARIIDAIYEAKLRLFDERDFILAPYSSAGQTNARDGKPGLLLSTGFGWEGWAASIMVLESDVPGFAEMRAENIELIRERDRLLREIIATF